MIRYQEKGAGLHRAISHAGHWLMEMDGVWQSSNDAVVQGIIDAYGLAESQNEICAAISAHAKGLRDKAVSDFSAGEMASWPVKRAEATTYLASGIPADAPMLSAECAARGVSLDAMASKVIGNALQLSQLEAAIAGTEGRHRDTVRSLGNFESVLSYDWSSSWPAL